MGAATNVDGICALTLLCNLTAATGNKYVRGCYAISVNGTLPEEAIDLMERQGLQYISREQGD